MKNTLSSVKSYIIMSTPSPPFGNSASMNLCKYFSFQNMQIKFLVTSGFSAQTHWTMIGVQTICDVTKSPHVETC